MFNICPVYYYYFVFLNNRIISVLNQMSLFCPQVKTGLGGNELPLAKSIYGLIVNCSLTCQVFAAGAVNAQVSQSFLSS